MRRGLALAVAAMLALAPAALAACPRTTLGDVEDEVMCPVCGTSLALATEAPQAQRQRELIRRLVDRCKSKDEVKAALVSEFGPGVLSLPEDEGFSIAAYLVPIAVLGLGAGLVALAALRWRRRKGSATPAGAPVDDADDARLDSDLKRYDL